MADLITIRTLTDGGQQPADIAHEIADFLAEARTSLDLAQYDFHLRAETAAIVAGAVKDAAARGVAVRFVYNVDHRNPIPVPPPPEPDVQLISSLGVPARPIAGIPDLMHHKYVVRDGEAVWSGSMNWTDESWSRQENVLVVVSSRELAARFTQNFEELWSKGDVEQSGFVDPDPVDVGTTPLRAWFTPGHGEDLSHRIARAIGRARRRVRIASPVLTSAPVLGTVAQVASDGKVDLAGIVDATQIQEVLYQWRHNGNATWKIPLLQTALTRAPFSGKRSTQWTPESTHDFMHAKVTVADDTVFLGSFNLSHSGERNAENVLELENAEVAARLAAFIDEIRARYPRIDAAALA